MTVAASTPLIEYTENGVTLAFAVPWRFLAAAHLVVTRIAVDGTVTQLVQGTHWSATGGTTDAGGTLTLVASVNGAKLRIARATPLSQADDYIPTGKFPADTLEGGFDRNVMIAQDASVARADLAARALQVPVGETVNALPKAVDRKGTVLGFHEVTGQPIVGPDIGTVLTVAVAINKIAIVADHIGNVDITADSIADVNAVGGNIYAVSKVSADLDLGGGSFILRAPQAAIDAKNYRDLAREWAENPSWDDVTFNPGFFSAHHHADRARDYAEAAALQGHELEAPVRLCSTANVALSGEQTIDGVAASAGDRVLLAGQVAPEENGLYNVSSGAWSRTTDFDDPAEVVGGAYVRATDGDNNAGAWVLTTMEPITVGVTPQTWRLYTNDPFPRLRKSIGSGLVGAPWGGTEGDASLGLVSSRQLGMTGSGDETADLIAALISMNSNEFSLRIDTPISINPASEIVITGFCDVRMGPLGKIVYTGGSKGITLKNSYAQITTWTATGSARYPAGTGSYVTYYDLADASGVAVGDVLYFKDSNTTSYGGSYSVGETFTVVAKSGSRVFLNGLQLDTMVGASGDVYYLPRNTCRFEGVFEGEGATARTALQVEGHVDPRVDIVVNGNSSAALFATSCYGGSLRAVVGGLKNNNSDRLGYGAVAYGACKGIHFEIYARDVRHAYTDGLWGTSEIKAGVARDITVTGACHDATSAAWDTHPYSDGIRFENIKAWSSHNDDLQTGYGQNWAVQLRGTNATIDGLETNHNSGIVYSVTPYRNSQTTITNFRHRLKLAAGVAVGLANQLISLSIYKIGGSGTQRLTVSNSQLGYIVYQGAIDFDEYRSCEFDFSKTSQGWPASPSAGGKHILHECTVRDPVNTVLNANDDWTFVGGSLISVNARNFSVPAGGRLTAINHSIVITGGGTVANNAYAFATGAGCTFNFKNVGIHAGNVAGLTVPWSDPTAYGGHVVKNLEAPARITGTYAWTPTAISAGGSALVSVPVAGLNTSLKGSVALSANYSESLGGCVIANIRISASNTVEVDVRNPTGSAVTPGAGSMLVEARRIV